MTTNELAREFSKQLHTQLGDKMADVCRLNAAETNDAICHSHDFCDANQVMLDALEVFGVEYDMEVNDVINKAWDIAKSAGFDVAKIKGA